jgi:hypothetical protein
MGEVIHFKPRLRVIECETVEQIEFRNLLRRCVSVCSMCFDTGTALWKDGEKHVRARCVCPAGDNLPSPEHPGAA